MESPENFYRKKVALPACQWAEGNWLAPLNQVERNDLLEVLDDRVGTRATLITSQLPSAHWHAYLNDPTLADAILDRVLHAAHKVELTGESLRKTGKSPA